MATRPVFLPVLPSQGFVREVLVEFQWHSGLALSRKQKSVRSLQQAAVAALGIRKPLEVSSKSESGLGRELSAFQLQIRTEHGDASVESLFQGSKLFAGGGPYTDLYRRSAVEAKRDSRIRDSGALIAFEFDGRRWPLDPKTLFYDWLYLRGLGERRDLWPAILEHDGFTDIEFNPERSINCQARSVALLVSLHRSGSWDDITRSPEAFELAMRAGQQSGSGVTETGQFSLL